MTQSFHYNPGARSPNEGSKLPLVQISLIGQEGQSISAEALVDSGASINVLPHRLGLAIGGDWETAPSIPPLAGNLAQQEAKALFARVVIRHFPTIELIFGWSQSDNIPVILGQTDFFQKHNIAFFGGNGRFEISLP